MREPGLMASLSLSLLAACGAPVELDEPQAPDELERTTDTDVIGGEDNGSRGAFGSMPHPDDFCLRCPDPEHSPDSRIRPPERWSDPPASQR